MPCAATYWYILLFGACLLRGVSPLLLVVCCAWYRLVSSCRLQLVVLACLSCRSSIVVGRACCCYYLSLVLSSCRLLVVPAGCSCRSSCRACSCGLVTSLLAVATAWPPWVPSGGPIPDHQGGGDFSKRGERQTETQPVPIFMREVKKNVVFQRKQR